MKHTKEPWNCGQYNNIVGLDGKTIQVIGFALSCKDVAVENTERIVACINACSGLTNEQLESGYIQKLITERDESLKLVKEMKDRLDNVLGVNKNVTL